MSNDTTERTFFDIAGFVTDVAGNAASAGIGGLLAGPEGVVTGVVGGLIVSRTFGLIINEAKHRMLGRREVARVQTVLTYAANRIQERQAQGDQIRDDDFFVDAADDRAPAEEILEGVILAAQREYQEKMLKYYGNLFANLAFHPNIDRGLANDLLRRAQRLSYRQMCLLAIIVTSLEYPEVNFYVGIFISTTSAEKTSVLADADELAQEGLTERDFVDYSDQITLTPGGTGLGQLLYDLMELNTIPSEELDQIAALLPHNEANNSAPLDFDPAASQGRGARVHASATAE